MEITNGEKTKEKWIIARNEVSAYMLQIHACLLKLPIDKIKYLQCVMTSPNIKGEPLI